MAKQEVEYQGRALFVNLVGGVRVTPGGCSGAALWRPPYVGEGVRGDATIPIFRHLRLAGRLHARGRLLSGSELRRLSNFYLALEPACAW
jgi:hypothetical protein